MLRAGFFVFTIFSFLTSTSRADVVMSKKETTLKPIHLEFTNLTQVDFNIVPTPPFTIEKLEKHKAINRSLFELRKRKKTSFLGLIQNGEIFDIYIGEMSPYSGVYIPPENRKLEPSYLSVEVLKESVIDESKAKTFLKDEFKYLSEDSIFFLTNKKGLKVAKASSYPAGGKAVEAILILGARPVFFPDSQWVDIDSIVIN